LEHEADRVAERVARMRGSDPSASTATDRNFADRGAPAPVHAGTNNAMTEPPPSVNETLSSPGQPLDTASRGHLEPRFGADFSQVRIHADDRAAESARAVHANAYTAGQHMVFGRNQFEPHTSTGQRLIAHELAHVVQQSGQPPVIQRQPQPASIDGPKAEKKSRLVRVERYWGSTSARAFFADGSNEEVTFIDTKKLDGGSRPEGPLEAVVNLTIDRSPSLSRPRVERASGASGSKVKVATRLSPSDRISTLPGKVRGEVLEAFLSDPENEPDPETMEYAADTGELLEEASDTMRIEMKDRDPATIATMETVDQWVSEQKSTLDKVGNLNRAKFTHLLNDIRRIGVTGRAAAEDLNAQDVELILSGAAGGQSDFQTFDQFKRGMTYKLRSGTFSIPAENADNPDFVIRNEYRKAWKAEAAGLRRMSRIAEAAQWAPFKMIAATAAAGSGFALLEGGAAWLAARGAPYALQAKWAGASLFATGALGNYLAAREEAKAAGMDPNSLLGIASTFSASVVRTSGLGQVTESATDTSILTGKSLDRSVSDRIVGGALGLADMVGLAYSFSPKTPGKLPDAPDSSAAKAGIKDADTTVGQNPPVNTHLPDPPAPLVAPRTSGRYSQSAELDLPGPHKFFKESAANQNITLPPPEAQVAKIPLAKTGTGDPVSARTAGDATVQTGPGAGGTKMSGSRKFTDVADPSAGSVQSSPDPATNLQEPPMSPATPAPKAQAPGLSVRDVTDDLTRAIDELKASELKKPMTRKKIEDLRKDAEALEEAEKMGADVSEKLKDIYRRYEEIDDPVAGEIARANQSRIPPPAPAPPKPGEVRNPSVPTATEPSGNFRWIEDNPEMSDYAKAYEHGAAGARSRIASKSDEVPALDWIKPGGTHARVKFDGMDDMVFVDRKTSIYRRSAPEQALRQSEALRQNGYTARWEVPDALEKALVERMFANLGITNITVKIVPTR